MVAYSIKIPKLDIFIEEKYDFQMSILREFILRISACHEITSQPLCQSDTWFVPLYSINFLMS